MPGEEGPETSYARDVLLAFDPDEHLCPACGSTPTDPAQVPDNPCPECGRGFCDRCFSSTGVMVWSEDDGELVGVWSCDDCFVAAALGRGGLI